MTQLQVLVVPDNNIININSYKKKANKNNKNMIVVIVLAAAVLSYFTWNYLLNSSKYLDIEIKESKNISYDHNDINVISPLEFIDKIEKSELRGDPILIYLYTSWCGSCKKQTPIMNEIARKFQNTDLKVLFVAIDKGANEAIVTNALDKLDNIYFEPKFLSDRTNFKELLKTKSIHFRNRIPFSVLIGRNSEVIAKFSGHKSFKFLDRKVMKSLFKESSD